MVAQPLRLVRDLGDRVAQLEMLMILSPPAPPLTQEVAHARSECVRYVQPLTPEISRSDAARIEAETKTVTRPENVHLVMASAGWRLVWATPDGNEEGIWFLKRTPKGYRTVDTWGGSISDAADRADSVKWATGRGLPLPLARCFASIGVNYEVMK